MEMNENVEMITGDPKKAINKLAWPLIASMLLIFLNNIIDSIWVAGLGPDPLAAIGYVTPLFMVLVGFGNGIGAGATSLISRYIGAEKRDDANNAAIHSAILSVVVSLVLTVIALLILEPLLKIMGASSVLKYAMDYGVIVFAFTAPILIPPIFGGAFRAEGDIKRATLPIAIVAVVNMILDPIFIYVCIGLVVNNIICNRIHVSVAQVKHFHERVKPTVCAIPCRTCCNEFFVMFIPRYVRVNVVWIRVHVQLD